MLRAKFFLKPRKTDLINIDSAYYLKSIKTPNKALEKKVLEALRWVANNKALGPN
jgi:hypothetical protein